VRLLYGAINEFLLWLLYQAPVIKIKRLKSV
jgi:hypothetical protein